ncbi:MAG: hypothetical protein AAF226_12280 [Verrucomicrobiota bacterium]
MNRNLLAAGMSRLGLVVLLAAQGLVYGEQKGIMPVSPEVLFSVFPESVKDWELKESTGQTTLDEWLSSRVKRKFTKVGDSKQTPTVTIEIEDTAKYNNGTGSASVFSNFQPRKNPERGFEYLYFRSFPAVLIKRKHVISFQWFVDERFVVQLNSRYFSESRAKKWISQLDIAKLRSVSDGKTVAMPEVFEEIRIDQLAENGNSKFLVSMGTSDILDGEVDTEEQAELDEIAEGTERMERDLIDKENAARRKISKLSND